MDSSLSLLVLGIRANHTHHALAADNLAVFTNTLNAGSNFHDRFFPASFAPAEATFEANQSL
jgi:hypothetical protein